MGAATVAVGIEGGEEFATAADLRPSETLILLIDAAEDVPGAFGRRQNDVRAALDGDRTLVLLVGPRIADGLATQFGCWKDHRVLLVDRATFPSDTHLCSRHPSAGRRAPRVVGLLDEVKASNCPSISHAAVRRRPIRAGRSSAAGEPERGRVRAAPDDPRQDPRGYRGRLAPL